MPARRESVLSTTDPNGTSRETRVAGKGACVPSDQTLYKSEVTSTADAASAGRGVVHTSIAARQDGGLKVVEHVDIKRRLGHIYCRIALTVSN